MFEKQTMFDGTIFCLYEDGMLDHMADSARMSVARFDLDYGGLSVRGLCRNTKYRVNQG